MVSREVSNRNRLTLDSVRVRAVSIPMRRPIVSKVGTFADWPLILVDVTTNEGIVGRAYIEPYLKNAVRYIGPALADLGERFKGRELAPLDLYRDAMKGLHLLGRQGMSLIAISALDMAIWDACAKAAGLPLAELLGGSVGEIRAYNTNGLWLLPLDKLAEEAAELVAEGDFRRSSSGWDATP